MNDAMIMERPPLPSPGQIPLPGPARRNSRRETGFRSPEAEAEKTLGTPESLCLESWRELTKDDAWWSMVGRLRRPLRQWAGFQM